MIIHEFWESGLVKGRFDLNLFESLALAVVATLTNLSPDYYGRKACQEHCLAVPLRTDSGQICVRCHVCGEELGRLHLIARDN
jgi:hypothetical protein